MLSTIVETESAWRRHNFVRARLVLQLLAIFAFVCLSVDASVTAYCTCAITSLPWSL